MGNGQWGMSNGLSVLGCWGGGYGLPQARLVGARPFGSPFYLTGLETCPYPCQAGLPAASRKVG